MDEKNQEPLFPEELEEMPPLDALEGMPPFDEKWLSEDAFLTEEEDAAPVMPPEPVPAPEEPDVPESPEEVPEPEESPVAGAAFFHAPEDFSEIPEPEVWENPAQEAHLPPLEVESGEPEVPVTVEDILPDLTVLADPEMPGALEDPLPDPTALADPEAPATFEDPPLDLTAPVVPEWEEIPDYGSSEIPTTQPEQSPDNPFFHAPEVYAESMEPEMPEEPAPEPAMPQLLDEAAQQPAQEETPEMKKKKKKMTPVKKGRPRRKKGDGFLGIPHLLATVLWLAIIVAIGTSLGKLLWVGAADVLAFGRENKTVTVTIVASDDINSIAAKLGEAGLVRYPELFKFYANLTGADEKITTGTFELNTILDYHALTRALSPSSSSRSVVTVTIPEGYNCRQIFNLLSASNVCAVDSLEEYAASGELGDYWFLENVTRGDKYCLEGFLFPDTYEFYENSTPKEALTRMLNGFQNRYSEELIAQIDTLNEHLAELMRSDGKSEEYIASHVYTVREVIIVASLIEKETAGSSESATIASVIYNRLFHWGDYPAYLNIDASILYVVDGDTSAFDTKLDSPFNTYTHTGLTPTPITNPGLTSIQAALNPESTGYYYYVLNPGTGLHQFSATQEEHDAWIDKFRSGSEE